jgi:putative membrane protein
MQKMVANFLLRWGGSSLGLWIAQTILGYERLYLGGKLSTVVIAGLVLALINMVLKPIIVFLSFPAIIITLGLFMFVVNGLSIIIASWLYDPFVVSGLWVAILAAVIVSIVNFLVSVVFKDVGESPRSHKQTKDREVIDV